MKSWDGRDTSLLPVFRKHELGRLVEVSPPVGPLEKLLEEHVELLASESLDEVADMMEVLFAIAKHLGHSEEAVLVRRNTKRTERGGFDQGLYLTQILPAHP